MYTTEKFCLIPKSAFNALTEVLCKLAFPSAAAPKSLAGKHRCTELEASLIVLIYLLRLLIIGLCEQGVAETANSPGRVGDAGL
jgi:hypothetical protein